jgi:formyl-CoA transferase
MSAGGPLVGLRVLDLGHVLAGPFAATLLADLGADVIKIEDPRRGDTIRSLGPQHEGVPLWWKVAGRNKRSLTLQLRSERGRALLLRLVADTDILIENFRPGTLERWSLGPEVLWERNPRLVILRISGYGQGPEATQRPGFGRVGEAMSGAVHLTGEPDGRPLHVGFSLGDATTGLLGALGALAALRSRDQTGRGEIVDLALFEALFRMIEWQLPMAEQLGVAVHRAGNAFPIGYAVGGSYEARDGSWVTISAATEASIRAVLKIVGGSELAEDSRFADFAARTEPGRMEEIDRRIAQWIATRGSDEAIRIFSEADVAVGLVYDAAMILRDQFFRERGAVVSVPDAELGELSMPGVVPRLTREPGTIRWAGPRLGEHNDEILRGLGLGDDEIEELLDEGVIVSPPIEDRATAPGGRSG